MFQPPFFPKFGKSANDLLSQKLQPGRDDNHSVAIKSQSRNWTITNTATTASNDLKKLNGKVNIKYADKRWGEATVEYANSAKINTNIQLSKLYRGLVVNAKVDAADQTVTVNDTKVKSKAFSGSVEGQYKYDNMVGTMEYKHGKNRDVVFTTAIGYEGFSLGCGLAANLTKAQQENDFANAIAFDGGIQYEDGNLVGTFIMESDNTFSASVYHHVSPDLQVAGKALVTTDKGVSLTLGAQHRSSLSTTLKGRVQVFDDQTFVLGGHVQHRLANPNLTVNVSQFFNSKTSTPSFGVGITFGDN